MNMDKGEFPSSFSDQFSHTYWFSNTKSIRFGLMVLMYWKMWLMQSENVSLLSWKRKQLWRKGSQLGLETIVDGVVKDGVSNVYSILTLEGISVRIKKLTWLRTTSKS
ncbi:hypothetical protein P8452_39651 [Trifolium repens]|nr:hypothetical protein P8452_39651 [Trifolium repens]